MSDSYYLDVTLEFPNGQAYDVSLEYFKKNVMSSMRQVFGEVAASINVDILKYDPRIRRAVLRVPVDYYTKLHSALTLCGNYEGLTACSYKIHKTGPLLVALHCDSRNYVH